MVRRSWLAPAVPDCVSARVLLLLRPVRAGTDVRDPPRLACRHGIGGGAVPADLPGDHDRRIVTTASRDQRRRDAESVFGAARSESRPARLRAARAGIQLARRLLRGG